MKTRPRVHESLDRTTIRIPINVVNGAIDVVDFMLRHECQSLIWFEAFEIDDITVRRTDRRLHGIEHFILQLRESLVPQALGKPDDRRLAHFESLRQ